MIDSLHYQLANALRLQGGCLCHLDYDMKVIGEKCLMCRSLEAFDLTRAAEQAADAQQQEKRL